MFVIFLSSFTCFILYLITSAHYVKISSFKNAKNVTQFSSFFNISISMMEIENLLLKFNCYFYQNNVCLVRNANSTVSAAMEIRSHTFPSPMATPKDGKE